MDNETATHENGPIINKESDGEVKASSTHSKASDVNPQN